ncbi:MAG: hypothetical protein OZ935_18785 [Pseudomonadota bacterium]|nr:hypothetical protein [Pseudomonadota bacterium]
MRRSKRPAASAVASVPAWVTLGGEPPRRRATAGLLLGFLLGATLAAVLMAFHGPRLATTLGLAVPIAADAAAAGSRPSRPTPEMSSVLDIDGLWYRVDALEAENAEVRAEAARLQAQVDAAESRIQIEKTTAGQLAAQVRGAETENARLKSDLIYLESLLPSMGGNEPMQIRGLQIMPDVVPNQVRWRAMLVVGGRKAREFSGHLQLVVRYELDRKAASLVVPKDSDGAAAAGMEISFERYRRVEGQVDLPAGAVLKSIQLRVLKGSSVQAEQSLSL